MGNPTGTILRLPITQSLGTETKRVMSQKATTDALLTKVPTTRKVNGKTLTVDIQLNATDIGAYTKVETDNKISEAVQGSGSADFVGFEASFPPLPDDKTPGPKWVPKDGSLLDRVQDKALWDWVNAVGLVLTEADWQAAKTRSHGGAVAYYSEGTDGTNFRLPDIGTYGMVQRPMGRQKPADRIIGFIDHNKAHTHAFTGGAIPPHTHRMFRSGNAGQGTTLGGAAAAYVAGTAGSRDESYNMRGGGDASTVTLGTTSQAVTGGTVAGTNSSEGGSEVTMKHMWCSTWIYRG